MRRILYYDIHMKIGSGSELEVIGAGSLDEAKKLDKSGMMKEQISQMQKQLQMGVPSKNQMRMAQMSGGRQKMPRR